MVLVTLDLSVNFDTISHKVLLQKLSRNTGISGVVLHWFRSYLTKRHFTWVQSETSDTVSTLKGAKSRDFFVKSVAIPATDLTIKCYPVWKSKGYDRNCCDIHWCFGGNSPLSYVKNKVLLFFFATTALSSKMIQLNLTIIWKNFSQYLRKYMVFKICSLKCFQRCTTYSILMGPLVYAVSYRCFSVIWLIYTYADNTNSFIQDCEGKPERFAQRCESYWELWLPYIRK